MSKKLTQYIVKELLSYCPDTGKFTWKIRSRKYFKRDNDWNGWNTKYANKDTGCISRIGDEFKTYVQLIIFNKHYGAHRIAWLYMTGNFPDEVDHIDGDGTNNTWNNLRNVDDSENNKNMRRSSNNRSGFTGVSWHKASGKWRASIKINRKSKHIGLFINIDDAIKARNLANAEYCFHDNHGSNRPK